MAGEFYNVLRKGFTSYADRYKNCDTIEDVESGEVLLSTREILDIPPRPEDIYHRVESHEKDRLDILAHKYYKNPLLWWVIAQANNIYDPLTPLETGTLIRIPNIESLYGNNGILL